MLESGQGEPLAGDTPWWQPCNVPVLWHCLQWDSHPRGEQGKGQAAGWGDVAATLSLQLADLLKGQCRVFLLFCTQVRAQHESFYTNGIKPVSTLHRQLVYTEKLMWACGYFFLLLFLLPTFLTLLLDVANIKYFDTPPGPVFPCICWKLVAVWSFNLSSVTVEEKTLFRLAACCVHLKFPAPTLTIKWVFAWICTSPIWLHARW